MKIGSFAKQHNVTINAVRHYIEKKLLLPKKDGSQYDFDENCNDDMKKIMFLKNIGFTLTEIQEIFSITRFSLLKSDYDVNCYLDLISSKKNLLLGEKNKIESSIFMLNEEIERLKVSEYKNSEQAVQNLGFPIDMLHLLSCPKCGNSLSIKGATIDNNMIFEGTLLCRCSYSANIDNGIIISDLNNNNNNCKINYDKYFSKSYKNVSNIDWINFMYDGLCWISKVMDMDTHSKKVILDLGTGSGTLYKHIQDSLKDSVYIATNNELSVLKDFKYNLEKYSFNENTIFICGDYLSIPLKNKSVDIILDYYASTRFSYFYNDYLFNSVISKLIPNGNLIGTYIYTDSNSNILKIYEKNTRSLFYKDNLLSNLKALNFSNSTFVHLDQVNEIAPFKDLLHEDDVLYQVGYIGTKNKTTL